jgi:hypothetical protein
MEFNPETVKKYTVTFVVVLLGFGGVLKYIDEQRVDIFKEKEDAIKLLVEAEAKEKYSKIHEEEEAARLKQREQDIISKEDQLNKTRSYLVEKEKKLSIGTELRQLATQYINEFASVDISKTCDDDEMHNSNVRKAKAILDLIESSAKQNNRPEYISFVNNQRPNIQTFGVKCKL